MSQPLSTRRYFVFGRDQASDAFYGPWWPLFLEDGPQIGESPEAVRATIRERLDLAGEAGTWLEIAVVQVGEWTVG